MKQNPEHVREYGSVLATAERHTLLWLAERLPSWVTSDMLTILGLASMVLAGLSFWAARWYDYALFIVVIALALNWFGDSLDGTVARVRKQQRPRYGYYVDHVIDIIGACFLFGGLAASGYMSPMIAMGLLVGYLLVAAELFLATYSLGIFKLSQFKMGPTELRILLAVGALYLLHKPVVYVAGHGPFLLFDIGGLVGIAGLGLAMLVSTARNTRILYQTERLPPAAPVSR